jgi:Lon protease-like protein
MAVLPMFPLGSVLVPSGVLTLHVFEPRYRALVRDCAAAADHEFGSVLIDRGHEVGGGDVRREVGTVARMVQVAELDDGRFAVVAVGVRRLRVRAWLPDDPYPIADIDDWPDDVSAAVDEELLRSVVQRTKRAAATALELGDDGPDPATELAADHQIASYQLVDLAPIGPADAYALLTADGPLARVRALEVMLTDIEAAQSFRLQNP